MTTTTTQQNPSAFSDPEVCDSCLTFAYDHGMEDPDGQDYIMRQYGGELPDHRCDAKDEPDIFTDGCSCGCYRR